MHSEGRMIDVAKVRCFFAGALVTVLVFSIGLFVWFRYFGDYEGELRKITEQYHSALEAERRAIEEGNRLRELNLELQSRIETATGITEELRNQNRELADRIKKLLGLASTIERTVGEIASGLGESGRILQDSLRILYEVAKGNGVQVEEQGVGN